ncbi:NAD-dependent malic enzyme [Xanthobacter oligotrophicus]|uniref:NAD-dependent malic enzyme n=1 Tax=Xanthobacter oligotrophicus TaxID=2607286 RepID=UPI001E4A6403|nr:NAD-dependent malic enzyme [Xanthobacter oligotrophicus]MCG5234340.1 NAD-dependent malic enzyme [Xanthobacter oligotrophicus]
MRRWSALEELLPVVYTPTVGAGCQQFSRLYHKPRGLFLSIPHQSRLDQIFAQPRFDAVEAIVVTDGERILGLGDEGAGGMGTPIGKLALYSGGGGMHPAATLPILLDVGTDNSDCLADPLYVGWRHERVRGQVYDDFIEAFVSAVTRRWPRVLLQWEDFAKNNATRLLERYRDRLCTFNDDVQGTAAVATGTLLAAVNVTGVPLAEQRVAVFGGGSAGCGIAGLIRSAMCDAGLSENEAAARFFMVDRDGLLIEGMPGLVPFQLPFVQKRQSIEGWTLDHPDRIELLDVVRNARPTVLIGVSGQAGAFTEPVIRAMAECNERPVIFPLSNPTSRAEATPSDIEAWTAGRVLAGVGSPFLPILRNGARFKVDQTNNSYIFPGIGLGTLAVGASRVSDGMFMAAAKALAGSSPARDNPRHNLLPPVSALREVAAGVALAVAMQAHKEGYASDVTVDQIQQRLRAKIWTPRYVPLTAKQK